ncbi:MAG: amino acid ABC transporter permease [Chloroflexi bacterium RBG_13_51_18]|nr:MAG: amino acid ABC transporter permease [Chloroflexi bacterium RBG_13_51_18]
MGRTFSRKSAGTDVPPPAAEGLKFIPGAEPTSRLDPWWWLVVAVILLVTLLMIFQPDPYWHIFLFVRDGLVITIELTVISFVFIIILGLIGGLGRIAKNPVIHFISSLYVEIIRGIPLLVQLIWWYFAAPAVIQSFGEWVHWDALATYHSNPIVLAVVGLVICYGAYMAEIFRAGIESIHKGQGEAARSLGMSYMQSMVFVILPQAIRVVLPPVGNEFIMLIKDTSLVSVVAVADLTRRGREFMAAHFNPIEVWTLIALLYLVLTLVSARVIAWLERRRKY